METSELEEEVQTALNNSECEVYHYIAPSVEPSRYPIIVYAPISDVPSLAGDNQEIAHLVTIRIHVITLQGRTLEEDKNFQSVCKRVRELMTDLQFVRQQTTRYVEDGKFMEVIDFVRGI